MKSLFSILAFVSFFGVYAQIPAYYSSIDFDLSGLELRDDIADLITATHTSPTSYSEVWDVLKISDLDPTDASVVLLIYGYNDGDGDNETDRTRDKNANGGDPGTDWNREHVYPKSLGIPNLGTSGPGSDPHHLRASDVDANGSRSNRKFADAEGNAGIIGSNWYPGDEWKGDVARMVMYMYLRYGSRCLPSGVIVGSTNAIDPNMIDLLLEWNADDEVSTFEEIRNNAIHDEIGNRNPFIDNPSIAKKIWGGPEVEDTWGILNVSEDNYRPYLMVYPNPAQSNTVTIEGNSKDIIRTITIYDISGAALMNIASPVITSKTILDISTVPNGIYFIEIQTTEGVSTQKLIIQ